MRKIFLILSVLFCSVSFAQNWNTVTQGSKFTYTKFLGAVKSDSAFILPTISILTNKFKDTIGSLARYNDSLYFRSAAGWINLSRSGTTDTNYLPLTFLANKSINGNYKDLYVDSIDNFVVQNTNSISLYSDLVSILRSNGTVLIQGTTIDINCDDIDIVANNNLDISVVGTAKINSKNIGTSINGTDFDDMGRLDVHPFFSATYPLKYEQTNGIFSIDTGRAVNAVATGGSLNKVKDSLAATTTVALNGKLDTAGTYINTIAINADNLYSAASYSRTNHVGTITQNLTSQTANKFFASATSGGSATPAFRSLVVADLPKQWIDSPQQVFPSGNIAFTGTTAPSGTTNNTYRWSRMGNLVTIRINMSYSVAATGITQVTFTFPSDMPLPENNITGYTNGTDNNSPMRVNGGNSKTIINPLSANINYETGTPKIRVNTASQNIQYLQIQGSYFTNN